MKRIGIKAACLVILLFLAVIKDFKSYKISNYITLTGIISGFIFQVYQGGWTGILLWFGGVMVPILLLAPLFLFKVLGAGDIKLFSVIGSFYGIQFVFQSIVVSFLLGAVLSVIHLIKYKQVFYRFHHLLDYFQSMIQINCLSTWKGIRNFKIIPYYEVKKEGYTGVIHFSLSIFAAVLVQFIFSL